MQVEFGDNVTRVVGYIGAEGTKIFSWLHYCLDSPSTGSGVVICPPLGVDYMNSHRAMRHVADAYARAGITAIRFDYLGTGDSDDSDPAADEVAVQLASIRLAIKALERETGCDRIGLFGFRHGATLAAMCSQDRPVEFLALWAPVIKGRQMLREITLLQRMQGEQQAGASLEAGGLVLNEATRDAWKRIDLFKLDPGSERILVIPADEIADEEKICAHWRGERREVDHLRLPGSAQMLVDAHFTRIPLDGLGKLVEMSAGDPDTCTRTLMTPPRDNVLTLRASPPDARNGLVETACMNYDECRFYLVTEPQQPNHELPMLLFLNSGANHHVGPNRLYVTLCRNLARLGFTCVRADLPGLGDAVVDDHERENLTYLDDLSEHVQQLINGIEKRPRDSKVVVAGLCSGAYGAFVSSVELGGVDVIESLMINPLTFHWEPGMSLEVAPSRDHQDWHWYMRSLRQGSKWRKLLSGYVDFGILARSLVRRALFKLKGWRSNLGSYRRKFGVVQLSGHLPADLAQAEINKVHLSLFLSDSDPGLDILMTNAGSSAKTMIRNETLSVYLIDNADHTFSMAQARGRVTRLIVDHLADRYIDKQSLAEAG